MKKKVIIKTSGRGWLAKLAKAYRKKRPVVLVDDARLDVDPRTQTVHEMGKQAGLSLREWTALLFCTGTSLAGMRIVLAGVADPEPTSKLGLLTLGGLICVAGGGFSAIWMLTGQTPEKVTVSTNGFECEWR